MKKRWSRRALKCRRCKSTERRHAGRGLCSTCYERTRKKYKAEWYQDSLA